MNLNNYHVNQFKLYNKTYKIINKWKELKNKQ